MKLNRHAVVLLCMLILSCTQPGPKVMRYQSEVNLAGDQVWPPLPEIPRYRYAGQLTGEDNFSFTEDNKPGAGERFFRWLVGLGTSPLQPKVLVRPQSGIVDSTRDRVYVTDQGRAAVFVFDERAGELNIWDQADGGAAFLSPVGVALGQDGNILVTDSELKRVIRLDQQGQPLGSFGAGILQRPTGIAIAPQGHIFVADTASHDIKIFDAAGELRGTIGQAGIEPGEFNGPTHLTYAHGLLAVSDTLNARVQLLTASGEPVRSIGRRGLYVGNLTRPKGVTMDSEGNLYIIESYYDHLLIFSPSGEYLLPIGGNGVQIGQFYLPAGVWSDPQDRIYIADMFNARVVVLQYLGG